jgi:hypothetical protein
MIALLFLMALLFPFSAASSDTGLVCAIDMGSNTFKLILGEMQEGNYVQRLEPLSDGLIIGWYFSHPQSAADFRLRTQLPRSNYRQAGGRYSDSSHCSCAGRRLK